MPEKMETAAAATTALIIRLTRFIESRTNIAIAARIPMKLTTILTLPMRKRKALSSYSVLITFISKIHAKNELQPMRGQLSRLARGPSPVPPTKNPLGINDSKRIFSYYMIFSVRSNPDRQQKNLPRPSQKHSPAPFPSVPPAERVNATGASAKVPSHSACSRCASKYSS